MPTLTPGRVSAHADVRPRSGVTRQPRDPSMYWIEDPKACGLRRIGFADEIAPRGIRHRGWYVDELQNSRETMRGIVFRLNNGRGFVAGRTDPWNYGPALIRAEIHDDEIGAAYAADSLAESDAEDERDYRAVSSARSRFDDIATEMRAARTDVRNLIAEMRAARRAGETERPTICAALQRAIRSALSDIEKMRDERRELARDFDRHPAWQDA